MICSISWEIYYLKFDCRESLKDVPDQITENINKKEYLTAAQLIVEARENLAGSLSNVDALKEVRSDLDTREEVGSNEVDIS